MNAWTAAQEAIVRQQAESFGETSQHVWGNAAMLAALATIDELRERTRTNGTP